MKIAIIIGTRAEYIKMFPIMLELQRRKEDYYFIHTGQHYLGNLCEIFGTKRPDAILSKEPNESSKFDSKESKAIKWAFKMIFKVRKELKKIKPKYVLYHGDTMSTGIASIGSSVLLNPLRKHKGVHLESGLRSFNLKEPFPEERIRRIVTRFSNILIVPSKESEFNVIHRRNIFNLGNTILDSVDYAYNLAKEKGIVPFNEKKFALISVHRHENIKNEKRLKDIVDILLHLKVPSYFTLHDNTRKKLEEFGLLKKLKENKYIKSIPPEDYISFVYQLSKCSLILCDGGSMQEESLIFKKPCIILRNATERPEGLKSNFQFLSKLDVEESKKKIDEYLDPLFVVEEFENPYGKVGVSKKIIEELLK